MEKILPRSEVIKMYYVLYLRTYKKQLRTAYTHTRLA